MPVLAEVDLAGTTVLGHDMYGKHLLTHPDDGRVLHTHLRLQGSWSVAGRGRSLLRHVEPEVRVRLAIVDGPTAYGLNLRVGELPAEGDEVAAIGHLGPNPMRPTGIRSGWSGGSTPTRGDRCRPPCWLRRGWPAGEPGGQRTWWCPHCQPGLAGPAGSANGARAHRPQVVANRNDGTAR